MIKRIHLLTLFAVGMSGCGTPVEEHAATPDLLQRFADSASKLALSDTSTSPLAALMSPDNQVGAPVGMQIWQPDSVLRSLGIKNGDVIASITGINLYGEFEPRWALTGKPFAEGQFNQGPNHPESEKYADFVQFFLDHVATAGTPVELAVHQRFSTKAERAEHGMYAQSPRLIRISFAGDSENPG